MHELCFSKQAIATKPCGTIEITPADCKPAPKDLSCNFTIQDNPNFAAFRRDIELEYKQKQLAIEAAYRNTIYGKP